MADDGYELIDAGHQRRLERLAGVLVDRPAPGADAGRRDPRAWTAALARFAPGGDTAGWSVAAPLPDPWCVRLDGLILELRLAAGGQLGVFPEQMSVWDRIDATVGAHRSRPASPGAPPLSVLSLFAYTGGASLRSAAAGARVVHVDAARTAVAWARRNAELSGLASSPVRWIVDDVATYVAREARRGSRYDGIVLDPPTYGHGTDGRAWRIDRDLEPLLATLAGLRAPGGSFVAVTAHSPGYGPERLADLLDPFGYDRVDAGWLELAASSGARLVLGAFAFGADE